MKVVKPLIASLIALASTASAYEYGWGVFDASVQPPQSHQKFQGIYDNASEVPTIGFVARAQNTIDIEIYEMQDPVFRQALRAALQKHVRIRVIKEAEPLDEVCKYFTAPQTTDSPDCLDQKRLVAQIVQSGGAFVPYNKQAFCPAWIQGKCLQHGKMILIDAGVPSRQAVLLSTGNFNSTNFCDPYGNPKTCNRDYTYISADREVVSTLAAIFERDLAGQPYDVRTLISPSAQKKITVSPYSTQPLVEFIRSAKKSIVIQNQYLREKNINQALIDAAKSGVKVFVNVASLCAFGPPKPEYLDPKIPNSSANIFTQFDQAGIKTRMFDGTQLINGRMGYLHAKAIVVDGRYAWVGSVNGSAPGTSANREFGIFFNNPAMVNHLMSIMRYDFMDPRGETWQESAKCLRDPPRPQANSAGEN